MPILLFMMTAPHSPHSSSLPPYFEGLNDVQLEAAQALEGPVLVLAGAGTGKTRVLTTRLAHLIQTGRAFPSQILAVTFTNKASTEMKERVSRLLGGAPVEGWALGTFHALAARMLRKHAELVGLTSSFTILDRSIFSIFIGGGVGIYMAIHGFGLLSLIAQQIVTTLLGAIFLWSVTKWRPGLETSKEHIIKILKYARYISFNNSANLVNAQSDVFLTAYFLGASPAGIYNAAKRLILSANLVMSSSIGQVSMPALSNASQDLR